MKMKDIIQIVVPVALIATGILCANWFGAIADSGNTYPLSATVTEVTESAVTLETIGGDLWEIKTDNSRLIVGEPVTAIFSDCGTVDNSDDTIVAIR